MLTVHIIDSIKIDVYSREHLPPHIHVLYAEYEILIEIMTTDIYTRSMPKVQLKKVTEWLKGNGIQSELLQIFYTLNKRLSK
jgi:transcriptional regulatory protein LevR